MKKTYLKPEMKEVTLMIKTNLMLVISGEYATEETSPSEAEVLEESSLD